MQTVAQPAEYQGDAVPLPGSSVRALLTSVPRISRRWWLRIFAAIVSIIVGYGFSRTTADGDYRMQTILFVVVSMGVFITFWGITERWRRRR